MIEQTVLTALGAVFITSLPFYQRAIKARYKRTSLGKTEGREDYEHAEIAFKDLRTEQIDLGFKYNDNDFRSEGQRRYEWFEVKQTNFFYRKPFTCLFCMTFWLGCLFGGLAFILLNGRATDFAGACAIILQSACACPLAEAFKRWFDSLPIKL